MDPEQTPDQLLEEEERPVDAASNDKQLDTSPFDKKKGEGKDHDSHSLGGKKGGSTKETSAKNGKGGKLGAVAGAAKSAKQDGVKEAAKQKAEDKAEKAAEQILKKAGPYGRAAYIGKKALEKIGLKIKIANPKVIIGIVAGVLAIILLPLFWLFFVITTIWDHPEIAIGLSWDALKISLGLAMENNVNSGAAGKFAYEYELKDGVPIVVAAPDAEKPPDGSLAYKYASIDWEKAKYLTVENYTNCQVNTKLVKSAIDGHERSVIDTVTLRRQPSGDFKGVTRALCINKVYPIFNTIMRSQSFRDGINKDIAVRFAYAEPKGAASVKGKSKEEINKVLRDKTLKRIWNADLKKTLSNSASNQAAIQTAASPAKNTATDGKIKRIDAALSKRNALKNPCEGITSTTACEHKTPATSAEIYQANVELISALMDQYGDNLEKGGLLQTNYLIAKKAAEEKCKLPFNIPMPNCSEQDSANKWADMYANVLAQWYPKNKPAGQSAGEQQPPSPAPSTPPGPTSGWPTSCQKNFQPPESTNTDKAVDNAIASMVNDLLCGLNPKNISLKGIELPKEERGADPNTASDEVSTAAIKTLCQFTTRLLDDDTYKEALRYRIVSAVNASWQAVTYAHTNRYRFLDINELNGDFYKIASFNKSQEYHVAIDNDTGGQPLEQIAIGDAIGTQRTLGLGGTGQDGGVGDRLYKQFVSQENGGICQRINQSGGKIYDRGSIYDVLSNNILLKAAAGNVATAPMANYIYKHDYQDLKKAIAALPYYTQEEPDVEKSARNMTLGDVLIYLVKARSNTSDAGVEEGPQNFNRMNLGMKAYMNAASLAMGGQFLRSEQSIAMQNQTETARSQESVSLGIAYRIFNKDNPRSLISRLSAATVATPVEAGKSIASTLINLFNPIDSMVSGRKSLAYYITGQNNTALASSDYDRTNLRLDPAGTSDEMMHLDPMKNADEIEGIEEDDNKQKKWFPIWDGCFKKFIPTEQLHLQEDNPDCIILFTSNKDLQRDYNYDQIIAKAQDKKFSFLKPITDKLVEAAKSDPSIKKEVVWPYTLALKYRTYHFYSLQADALLYLSNPDKEDESLNASSSKEDKPSSSTLAGVQCPANMESGPNGYFKMPEAPNGEYVIYSSQGHRYGSKQLICVIYSVALAYNQVMGGKSKLHIGDLNASGHKSHKWGVAVDLDGEGSVWASDHINDGGKYNTDATITLGKLFIDTGAIRNIWWCEPGDGSTAAIINYANSSGKPLEGQMKCIVNHANHFHVDIKMEYRGPVYEP